MSDIDWVLSTRDAVQVGDVVSADAGGMPLYRVVGIADGQAWVEDERSAAVRRIDLDRCPWKARYLRA